MKKLLISTVFLFILALTSIAQESHLSRIYDFNGKDFDFSVKGMVGMNDSLYVLSNTPNQKGKFFRIDENGDGYKMIWEFDDLNYQPYSLVANDSVIYGTTRFSPSGGGSIFEYSLKDYSFKFIKDFSADDVQDIQVKYITDSVLWLLSQSSFNDYGSIFSIKKDGADFKKIYNNTNQVKGQNPVDFVFHNDSIYIAFYNGGGKTYVDASGTSNSSGCFVRIKTDGTGYEKIIDGGDDKGTQPQSLIIQENKLIGLFGYSGSNSNYGGQFFRSNLNGTAYDSLGALKGRSLTKMMSTDSLIYGLSLSEIFGVNPFDGQIRIFEDLTSNPSFGFDVVSNPAELKGNVFIATQQGGDNEGGAILKWTNSKPLASTKTIVKNKSTNLDLISLFKDPEGDSLTYNFDYNKNEATVTELNGQLTVTPLIKGEITVKIIANDGWRGYSTCYLKVGSTASILNLDSSNNLIIYPNPTNSILNFGTEEIDSVEILALDGCLIKSFQEQGSKININFLEEGVYLVRYQIDNCFYTQKIIKN